MTKPPLPPDIAPPKVRWLRELRLSYRSQRASVRIGLVTLFPLVLVGAVSAVFSIRAAGAAVTLDVLIGARSAFSEHAGAGGVLVAAVGYLLVPALASVLIAEVWARMFDRSSRSGGTASGSGP
jgi:hypothetical protein